MCSISQHSNLDYVPSNSVIKHEDWKEKEKEDGVVNAFGVIEPSMATSRSLTLIIFQSHFIVKHLAIAKLPIGEDDHYDGCLL